MTRAALHQLVDEIPDSQVNRMTELIRAVNADDRVGIQLALAEETQAEPDEIAALEELERDPDRGKTVPFEEVLGHFGMTKHDLC